MKIKLLYLSSVIFISLFLSFYNLEHSHLENWDEAWYGEMTRQMLVKKDFIIPIWNNAYRFDKPPLQLWLSAVSSKLSGEVNEFSVRFPSAVSGLLIILGVTYFVYKKYGIFPSVFSFVSLAFNPLFLSRARSGNIDSLPTLLILISFFLILSKNKFRLPILGLVFAVLYLAKASLVFFPLAIFFLHEIFYNRAEVIKNISQYVILGLIMIIPPIIWLYAGWKEAGVEFLNYYLFQSDQGVLNIRLSYFNIDYLKYTYYSLKLLLFSSLILGAILYLKKIKKPLSFLTLTFSFCLLLLLTFTERKNNWYLVPAMPFWGITIGYGVYFLTNKFNTLEKSLAKVLFLIPLLFISYNVYIREISPLFFSDTVKDQAEAGIFIKSNSSTEEIVIRLDHLYPTTIYYTERKVLASPDDKRQSGNYYISRNDLKKEVEEKKFNWISGTKAEMREFLKEINLKNIKKYEINSEEVVLRLK